MSKPTVRYSLKTIAKSFPLGSVVRVYLQGTWQRERGRHPTMLYGNYTDPRMSYQAAKEAVGTYIESIRRTGYSRNHDWSCWVEAIMMRLPLSEVEYT